MKRVWMALAGMGFLLSAGCPVMDVASMPEVSWHGKVKADLAFNSESTSGGASYVSYVDQTTAAAPGDEFQVSAIDTRLIAQLGDPEMGDLTGKIEVDFHDDDVLFRHAFVKMKIADGMSLLAGQTSDVVAPLMPNTLNWFVGWQCGNIGHRSPQLRWEYDLSADAAGILVQVALQEPAPGQGSTIPDIHGRVQFKLGDDPGVALGAAIVLGTTDLDTNDEKETVDAFAIDVNAKVSDQISIKGEFFAGQNITAYMGGIGEIPSVGTDPELSSTGLWVQVGIKATDTVTINAGLMFEDNDGDDINNNDRESNSCIFGNVLFKVNDCTTTGIEISRWETEYKGDTEEYDCFRIQGSVIVKF